MRMLKIFSIGAALAVLPTAAQAQWTPGSELAGQAVQIESNGVANTVYFDQGGAARIVTARGSTIAGTWTSGANGVCLNANGGQECWSYSTPMTPNQPVSLTSSCGAVSTWSAAATNSPPPQPPQSTPEGERG